MERLKSTTIIFLLAVSLLTSAAPAKPASVLLQEGLYAEEIEGDLDAAIKIYEQVIAEAKEAQQAAAQATYRIGMCYLKKGENAKAAIQFSNLVSRFPEQKPIVDKACKQLAKLRPPMKVFEPPALIEQIKSGKVPSFKVQLPDNTALDIDSGEIALLKDKWPDRFDVAWDNDGGGALMKKAGSVVRFLDLPSGEKQMWDEAIYMARSDIDELRNSNTRGIWASRSKFAAVLTSEGNLAVIRIGEYDAKKGTIYGWVEKIPAVVFGPVVERVMHQPESKKDCMIDFESGRLFAFPENLQDLPIDNMGVQDWLEQNGIDAIAAVKGKFGGLEGVRGLIAVSMHGLGWDASTNKLVATIEREIALHPTPDKARMFAFGGIPFDFFFKTSDGGMGVLQLLEIHSPHIGTRIRYKMLQQSLADIETLIKEMHQPEAQLFAALNKLIKIGSPAVEPLISELQKSNNWQVPKALGAIGDKRAVEPLIQKWQKCDWSPMKEVIAEALERITGKKLGQDKQKWDKWWQETKRFISPEATIKSFMAASMKIDMNNAMACVADDSHDYEDIKRIFEKPEHPFNILFRKTDPDVPIKIIETKIIDNMCEAVWQVTFKEDFTIKGKTFKTGETFDIDGNLHRYEDKWLITGI